MRIFLSESMCKKLCVNVVFVSYDFPKKKIGKKRSEKRMRYAVGDRALVGLLSRARNRGALRTRAHARRRAGQMQLGDLQGSRPGPKCGESRQADWNDAVR